jgi:PAS domain-containing protein
VKLPDGGVVRTYADVTERRKAERSVRESEARYRLLADHSTDMIVRTDLDSTRRFVSPASKDLLGYEPHELVGTRPLDSCTRTTSRDSGRSSATCPAARSNRP